MSIYRRFISEKTMTPEGAAAASSKLVTPANALTASRPVLAGHAARMLVRGERYVTPWIITAAATDMEGIVARAMDKYFPAMDRGTTKIGIAGDKHADVLAMLILSGAALRAPRVSAAGKLAVATVLGQEGVKIVWALSSGWRYRRETGMLLDVPPSVDGKEATAEKLTAVCAAAATNDTDSWTLRRGLDAVALGFAGVGTLRGEKARQDYVPIVEELLGAHAHDQAAEANQ